MPGSSAVRLIASFAGGFRWGAFFGVLGELVSVGVNLIYWYLRVNTNLIEGLLDGNEKSLIVIKCSQRFATSWIVVLYLCSQTLVSNTIRFCASSQRNP